MTSRTSVAQWQYRCGRLSTEPCLWGDLRFGRTESPPVSSRRHYSILKTASRRLWSFQAFNNSLAHTVGRSTLNTCICSLTLPPAICFSYFSFTGRSSILLLLVITRGSALIPLHSFHFHIMFHVPFVTLFIRALPILFSCAI